MIIEQIVEIPVDQQIDHLNLKIPMPKKHPSGRVKVAVILTSENSSNDNVTEADIEADISANPPDFDEFCRLCEKAKKLDIPNLYSCEEILEEASKRSDGTHALDLLYSAKKIRYWLNHQELWDETTRSIRETREWDDHWQAPDNG